MNALETGTFHHKGPFGGPRWGADIPGYLKERCDFYLSGDLVCWGNPRYVLKKALETGNSLHNGPDGEPEGEFVYQGL
jgi:hypothetical protein